MKLAFSTLGCPGWSWDEIFATGKDLGIDGIEIRGITEEIYAPKTKPFLPDNISKTLKDLDKAGIEIPIFTSSVTLSDEKNIDKWIAEAKEYIDLAEKANAQFIRVMCENTPGPESDIDLAKAAIAYAKILDYAKPKNIFPLIETNGILANSDNMLEFLALTNRDNAFVLWDINHSYRYYNETPKKTVSTLSGFIKYVHVKDSVLENGKIVYKMMGSGDFPIIDVLSELKQAGYDGYLSLEWVKRWNQALEEPGIVFYHFANYMKQLLAKI